MVKRTVAGREYQAHAAKARSSLCVGKTRRSAHGRAATPAHTHRSASPEGEDGHAMKRTDCRLRDTNAFHAAIVTTRRRRPQRVRTFFEAASTHKNATQASAGVLTLSHAITPDIALKLLQLPSILTVRAF